MSRAAEFDSLWEAYYDQLEQEEPWRKKHPRVRFHAVSPHFHNGRWVLRQDKPSRVRSQPRNRT